MSDPDIHGRGVLAGGCFDPLERATQGSFIAKASR